MVQWKPSYCPPRRNFRPASRIRGVKLELKEPGFVHTGRKPKGARLAGLRYERKVQDALVEDRFYVRGPWFSYWVDGLHHLQYCQVDGLKFDFERGVITVVEIKLQHTSDAWWQLRHLYIPVVACVFGDKLWKYAPIEICRWYDPETPFPEPYRMVNGLSPARPDTFGVCIWKR